MGSILASFLGRVDATYILFNLYYSEVGIICKCISKKLSPESSMLVLTIAERITRVSSSL